jgi:hypothetical protein
MQAAALELENAQRRHLTAQIGQRFISALVTEAGFQPEEFARFEVVVAEEKVFLRAV